MSVVMVPHGRYFLRIALQLLIVQGTILGRKGIKSIWRSQIYEQLFEKNMTLYGNCTCNTNIFNKGVNDSSKVTTYSGKRLSTTSGKDKRQYDKSYDFVTCDFVTLRSSYIPNGKIVSM